MNRSETDTPSAAELSDHGLALMRHAEQSKVTAVPTADERVLQAVWKAIRKHHPTLPAAVEFVVLPAAKRQLSNCASASTAEPRVLVAEATLQSPDATLELLLHFAAHALAGGGLSDSSNHAYHLAAFRQAAQQLGLQPVKTGTGEGRTYGSRTTLADPKRYEKELALLSGVERRDQPN